MVFYEWNGTNIYSRWEWERKKTLILWLGEFNNAWEFASLLQPRKFILIFFSPRNYIYSKKGKYTDQVESYLKLGFFTIFLVIIIPSPRTFHKPEKTPQPFLYSLRSEKAPKEAKKRDKKQSVWNQLYYLWECAWVSSVYNTFLISNLLNTDTNIIVLSP